MKNSIKLKTLVSFSFVIFFFPFLQTCSDKNLMEFPIHKVEAVESLEIDSVNKPDNSPHTQTEILEINNEKDVSLSKKENTVNFYELLNRFFEKTSLRDFSKSTFEDKTFYPLFGFILIFVNSILLLIFTYFNKYKLTFKLGSLNLVLLILSTVGLILTGIVEDINQLKIGYYLFAGNSIFIILGTKNKLNRQRNYS